MKNGRIRNESENNETDENLEKSLKAAKNREIEKEKKTWEKNRKTRK